MIKNSKRVWSRLGWVMAAILAATAGAATAQSGAKSHVLVLEGGTLIDGTGRAPITDPVIVVEGNRIKAVGKRGQVAIPAGAQVIKTDKRTILPGLIDGHTHTQDYHIPMFLHYGITTIQDKNNDPAWVFAEREALRDGLIKNGPRMFAAGAEVYGTQSPMRAFNMKPARTVEEAVAMAQSRLADGGDFINMGNTVDNDQLRAVAALAKERGVPLAGHVQNIRVAAGLGATYQEHMFSMGTAIDDPEQKTTMGLGMGPPGVPPEFIADPKKFPDLISYMVSKGIFVNPTLAAQWSAETPAGPEFVRDEQALANDPNMAFVPAEVRAEWNHPPEAPRLGYANVAEFLKEYAAAGGRIIVGTDASWHTIPGLSLHYEMRMLVDAGVPPMKAIMGATLWNAQQMMKEKDLGSVEPGKLADFTIIEGDPLADINATRNVRVVIRDGVVLDTRYDPKWVNPIPASGTANHAAPSITKISPAVVRQNGPAVNLDIEGEGFVYRAEGFRPNSIVRFDNVDLPTTFVSAKKLTAQLPANLLQRGAGLYPLYVFTPGLHGVVSPPAYVVIDTADNPVAAPPVAYKAYADEQSRLFGPAPRSARQGSGPVQLEIEGTKFAANAIARLDNVDLPTKFVSATKVTATVDAKFMQRHPGSYVLYVLNPGIYGNVSEAGYFQVNLKK